MSELVNLVTRAREYLDLPPPCANASFAAARSIIVALIDHLNLLEVRHGGVVSTPVVNLRHILLVDDDEFSLTMLANCAKLAGFSESRIHLAASADVAFGVIHTTPIDVAVVDHNLGFGGSPGTTGLDVVRVLHTIQKYARSVVLTGSRNPKLVAEAEAAGAMAVIGKRLEYDSALTVIHAAMTVLLNAVPREDTDE